MLELLDSLWFEGPVCDVGEVRHAIAAARPKATKALLEGVIELALESTEEKQDALKALGKYADRLAYESEFALAAHVYEVQINAARDANFMWLLPAAYQHLASCQREMNDLLRALETYNIGETLATEYGDEETAIRILIGRANLLRVSKRFNEARSDLGSALQRARAVGEPDLIGRASHELGIAMYRLGKYVEALTHYAEALRAFVHPPERHRLLNDIGRALGALGVLDAARDAHLAVYSAKSELYVRQAAAINLMALAHETRDRVGFDLYRAVPRARMPLRFLLAYFFELGDGAIAFGLRLEARDAFEHAARVATRLGDKDDEKKARQAMVTLRARLPRKSAPPVDFPAVVHELLATLNTLKLMPDMRAQSVHAEGEKRGRSRSVRRALGTRRSG